MPVSISGSRAARKKMPKQSRQVDRKVEVVLEGLRKHRPVKEICREAGISPTSYYHWQHQVIDAARTGIAHPEYENWALKEHLRELEAENASLRRQVRVLKELCVAD